MNYVKQFATILDICFLNHVTDPCEELPLPCTAESKEADTLHCDQYYECLHGSSWISRSCSDTLGFDIELEACRPIWEVDCNYRCPTTAAPTTTVAYESTSETSPSGSTQGHDTSSPMLSNPCNPPVPCNPNESPLLPDPENCEMYYQCIHGEWIKRPCASSLRFDSVDLVCTHASDARCQEPCPSKPTENPATGN